MISRKIIIYGSIALIVTIGISVALMGSHKGGEKKKECVENTDCTTGQKCTDGKCVQQQPASNCVTTQENINSTVEKPYYYCSNNECASLKPGSYHQCTPQKTN